MDEKPESLDHTAAGLLNGTMLVLLGVVFPALFAWAIVSGLSSGGLDLKAMTESEIVQGVLAIMLTIYSIDMVRSGARMIRHQVKILKDRRG